ncbi:hypothetical protein EV00_0412 [Prochlorococcus marinus str. MIT 9322]|uniref:Uncharacterized protein n=1 Tax=Prochlorococcus marinus str. MIT 9401 TaxID=167551 RepID=A0A0A2B1M0_PROMR|nr:hypothetical protein EV00_0412 [Prochlorococcus marinus str. MIT 9322]KGG06685.1 hypothetical protein EV01_1890 [Prochlorococcus marinus str. MIT 9401]
MELTCFRWILYDSFAVNQVKDTNFFKGLKPLSFIVWK